MNALSRPFFILSSILLFVAVALQVWLLSATDLYVWDGSVYIGMGKWFFSHGTIGLFENFRPIGLPLIAGFLWKLGADPLLGLTIVVIASSLALLYFVYRLGERVQKYAGVFSLALVAFTPLFLIYGHLPMSDVISTFFAVGACVFFVKQKHFQSGIFVGIAFLMRFPQGLMLIVLGATTLLDHLRLYRFSNLAIFFKRVGAIVLGFGLIVLPYFLWAADWFGDPFLPLKEGNAIIGYSKHFYQQHIGFYFSALVHNNPLLIFGGVGVLLVIYRILRKKYISIELLTILVAFVIYSVYFTIQPHKEIRYALSFLPFGALLGGYALAKIFHYKKATFGVVAITALLFPVLILFPYFEQKMSKNSEVRNAYYSYFYNVPQGTPYIATEPMGVAGGSGKLVVSLYSTWGSAREQYEIHRAGIDYVSLDSCVLEAWCSNGVSCKEEKNGFLASLEKDAEKVFSGVDGACTLSIYQLSK